MPQRIFLSYLFHDDIPTYGNYVKPKIHKVNSISRGDTANKTFFEIDSHMGTHIDFPYHFLHDGKKGEDYGPEEFFYKNIVVAEVERQRGLIDSEDLSHLKPAENTEAIILKTGLCHKRDSEDYWKTNAGIHPESAAYLKRLYPNLRLIAFDLISLNSFEHREEGRIAHKEFLSRGILILEDVDLRKISAKTKITELIVAPFRFADADGAQCTVIAQIENE